MRMVHLHTKLSICSLVLKPSMLMRRDLRHNLGWLAARDFSAIVKQPIHRVAQTARLLSGIPSRVKLLGRLATTLTPAFEIQHPVAFKDGSGGLKPPIYYMKGLCQWILGHKPTFAHTGLYCDPSQVAAVPMLVAVATASSQSRRQLRPTYPQRRQPSVGKTCRRLLATCSRR